MPPCRACGSARLGYIIAPPEIIDRAKKVHDFLTVGAAAPLQEAVVTGLKFGQDYYDDLQAKYTHKKDLFLKGLDDLKIAHTDPQGAYYVLLDIAEFGYESDLAFCEDLAHYVGVGAVPGSSFFREPVNNLIRLHFAKKEETLLDALNRLEGLRDKTKPKHRYTGGIAVMDVKKAAAETKDYIVSIRREFHRHPELSLQEFRSAQRIEEELDKFGIPHTRVGETGVLGTLKGAKDNGKVLVLRADIDALPIEETHECVYRSENAGVMHACGHDAHAACLLGAAKILSENRDAFSGKVRLVFQPGEEIGKGAKPFVAAGVLDGAERVFGLHTAYDL